MCATKEVKPERPPINLPNQRDGLASLSLRRDITRLWIKNNKVKIPMESDSNWGVITEKNKYPMSMPIAAGSKMSFRIRLSALSQNRRRPNISIAISKGSKIAKASVRLDWLAINGGDKTPSPAPKPLFDILTISTLIAAKTKNAAECSLKAWTNEVNKSVPIAWWIGLHFRSKLLRADIKHHSEAIHPALYRLWIDLFNSVIAATH